VNLLILDCASGGIRVYAPGPKNTVILKGMTWFSDWDAVKLGGARIDVAAMEDFRREPTFPEQQGVA
jgi:hypothetical protein